MKYPKNTQKNEHESYERKFIDEIKEEETEQKRDWTCYIWSQYDSDDLSLFLEKKMKLVEQVGNFDLSFD